MLNIADIESHLHADEELNAVGLVGATSNLWVRLDCSQLWTQKNTNFTKE